MPKKSNSGVSPFLLFVIILTALSGAVFVYLSLTARFDYFRTTDNKERAITTLFIIEDNKKPLAAYIMIYYPLSKRAAVFDIPNDIGRIIKQVNRVDRIDIVYDPQHLASYQEEIENLVDLQIDYTIVFNIENLCKIVDLLDGVLISVPQPIQIYDEANRIFFPSGWVNLDGDKTKNYLLYEGDIDESELAQHRRQRFFIGLLKKLNEKNKYLKAEEIEKMISPLFKINTTKRIRKKLFDDWANIDTDRIVVQTVGGDFRVVSGQSLLIPYRDGSEIKDIVRQTLTSLTHQSAYFDNDRLITVEVLNGTSLNGLAGRTAELIRSFGYNVVNISNADRNDYEKTFIIGRIDRPQVTQIFAEIVHCANITLEPPQSQPEPDDTVETVQISKTKADFTLVLGRDYDRRFN